MDYPVPKNFEFDDIYEQELDYKTKQPIVAWNRVIQYRVKRNLITDENFEEFKRRLDPLKKTFFLFSKDDNPDWEKQELLMEIMERIHLG
jgi:hypothetical protein